MEKRITPENIGRLLPPKTIFVFGSNESGIHGAGAARLAYESHGATLGLGFGFSGSTFGIPTKDWDIKVLPLNVIKFYVERFIAFTKLPSTEELDFWVTKIGCGLAGFTPEEIAPMFAECLDMENVWLPEDFIEIIEKQKQCV